MIIIVTNHALPVGNRFPIFLFKTKTRTAITMAKLFHFLACNVSVKSKLQHPPPPRPYPGHLMSFPAREGGNLINLVFPGAGI